MGPCAGDIMVSKTSKRSHSGEEATTYNLYIVKGKGKGIILIASLEVRGESPHATHGSVAAP